MADIRCGCKKAISAPFDPNQWSYPWYVMEISPGNFENTLGDPIQAKDTAHLVHNSNCMVTEQIGETPFITQTAFLPRHSI